MSIHERTDNEYQGTEPITDIEWSAGAILEHEGVAPPLFLGDLAVGVVYGSIGIGMFGWLEKQARRRGAREGV